MLKDLSSLLVARITHDLANPLGAIGNGVELMEMIGAPDSPELALIREASATAQSRLRLCRVAFGAPKEPTEGIESLLADFAATGKVTATCTGAETGPARKKAALLLLCASSCLPRGGQVKLLFEGSGISGLAEGASIISHDDKWPIPDQAQGTVASFVHFDLLGQLLLADTQVLDVGFNDTSVRINITG